MTNLSLQQTQFTPNKLQDGPERNEALSRLSQVIYKYGILSKKNKQKKNSSPPNFIVWETDKIHLMVTP